MKKIFALLLACSLLLTLALLSTSCDFQGEVDSVRTELMDTAKDLLDPFLNRSESHTTESSVESEPTDSSTTDSSGVNM